MPEEIIALIPILSLILSGLVINLIVRFIEHLFFKKKENKKSAPTIKVNGDMNGDMVTGNKTVYNNSTENNNSIETFEKHVSNPLDWERKLIDGKEVWIYKKDSSFQIKTEQQLRPFTEPWMEPFSFDLNAKKGRKYNVSLLISETKIHQIYFIQIEPNKSFVPMPKQEFKNGKLEKYFWERNSLEHKIYKIIKPFYDKSSLEDMTEESDLLEMR